LGVTEAFALPETEHPLHALKLKGDGYIPPKEFICLLYGIANDGSRAKGAKGAETRENKQSNLTMVYHGTYEASCHGCQTWIGLRDPQRYRRYSLIDSPFLVDVP
jgi:hypothetical protein